MSKSLHSDFDPRLVATTMGFGLLLLGCWVLRAPHAAAVVLGLLDLYLLLELGVRVGRAFASRRWPAVAPAGFRGSVSGKELSKHLGEHLELKLGYRYLVDGREYLGRRWSFPFNSGTAFESAYRMEERRLSRPGKALVHYDPRNPARSVIRPGLSAVDAATALVAGLVLGGVLTGLALYLAGRLV